MFIWYGQGALIVRSETLHRWSSIQNNFLMKLMYWRCTKRSRCEDPRLSMYREGCTGRSNGPLLNPANVSYELDVPGMYREHKNHLSTFWSLCQAPSTTLAPQVITEVGQAYQTPKLDYWISMNEPMSTETDGQHLSGYVPGDAPGYRR